MRYGIVTANLGDYTDPRVAVRLAGAAKAAGWEAFFDLVRGCVLHHAPEAGARRHPAGAAPPADRCQRVGEPGPP
jgi:hypothetical protein